VRCAVLLLLVLTLAGCTMPSFSSCKAVGATDARFGATWTHGNVTSLDDALAQAGWTQVADSKWFLLVNESVQVFAVTGGGSVGPVGGVVIGFDAHGTNVTSEDQARVVLEPMVTPVLRAAEPKLGKPTASSYEGGHLACG